VKYVAVVLPIFAIMGLGWFLRRIKVIKGDVGNLENILYWGILPALLFRSIFYSGGFAKEDLNLLYVVYISFIIMPAVSFVMSPWKKNPQRRGVSLLTCMRSNNIYMGIPVVSLVMGEVGVTAASKYLGISLVGYHIFSVACGQLGLYGKLNYNAVSKTLKELAKNPLIISCIFAMVCSEIFRINLPLWIDESLKILSNSATALALLALGVNIRLREMGESLKETWIDILMKNAIYPLLLMFLFFLWPVAHNVRNAVILVSAMPVAVNTFIVAKGMNMDHDYAARLIATSTFVSLITIPLWVAILF